MVCGLWRIFFLSLFLIGREKEKKEKYEYVNYLIVLVKVIGFFVIKKMLSCKFMLYKVFCEKRVYKFRIS